MLKTHLHNYEPSDGRSILLWQWDESIGANGLWLWISHIVWCGRKIFSDFVKSPCRANCSQLRSTLDLVSDSWYLFGTVVNNVVFFF